MQKRNLTRAHQRSNNRGRKKHTRSWDALYKYYRLYGHCDDGMAAEAYSESIARILVDHWETLPRLAELIEKDAGFGNFVGLNATMNVKDLAIIKDKAIRGCPSGMAKLCSRLRRDAGAAIEEENGAVSKKH